MKSMEEGKEAGSDLAAAIGERLRRQRAERGLTQAALAGRAGLHRSTVSAIERGRQKPAWETVEALAAALGIQTADLLPLAHTHVPSDAWASGRQLRLLTDSLPALVCYVDAEQRYVFNNRTYQEWFGRETAYYRNRTVREVLGEQGYAAVQAYVEQVLRGDPVTWEASVPYRDGGERYVEGSFIPDCDESGRARGYFSLIADISDRKRTEGALRFVAEAGRLLTESLDYETTLRAVANLAAPAIADWCIVDLLDRTGDLQRVAIAHTDPDLRAIAHEIHAKYPPDLGAPYGVGQVLRTGEAVCYTGITDENLVAAARDAEHLRLLRALDLRTSLSVPLRAGGAVIGTLTFVRGRHAPDFTEADRTLIEDLARHAGTAISNARLYQAAQDEIAHRRRVEAALRENEERFRVIAEGARDIIYRFRFVEPHGFEYISPSVESLSGYAPEDFYRDPDLGRRIIYPGDPLVSDALRAAPAGLTGSIAQRWIRRDGTLLWMEHTFSPIVDGTGRITGFDGIARDITERRRAEEVQRFAAEAARVLAASLDFAETVRSVAQVAVPALADWCLIDLLTDGGEIRRLATVHPDPIKNDLLAQLTRFVPHLHDARNPAVRVIQSGRVEVLAEVTPATFLAAVHDAEHLAILHALAPTSTVVLPLVARERILGAIWLATAQAGRRYGPADVALAEDLAQRAALALDNARLYEAAQTAIRDRDEFLSIASHELRTPVAGIKGYAQMLLRALERGRLDPERLTRSIDAMNDATDRLSELTADLLDVSRIRLGQLPIRPRLVDFGALVFDFVSRYADQLGERHPIALDLPAGPVPLWIDADRIGQILANLLDNAAKYSPAGGTIMVRLTWDEGALLAVHDRGIGLPRGAAEQIFEPFGRAANAVAQNLPGMGLGLYICRDIAGRHGGRMWAESAGEGQGTTFCLWLPPPPADVVIEVR